MSHIIEKLSTLEGESLYPHHISAWKTVGALFVTDLVHQLKYIDLAIYPSFYFIPNHYTKQCQYRGPFQPFADQYWGSCPTSDFNY